MVLDPGTYLWTSPIGYQYVVDHRGTRDLGRVGGLDTGSLALARLDQQGHRGDPPER